MRFTKTIWLAVALLLGLAACKKNNDTPTPVYEGTWRVANDTLTRYWVIANDGIVYQLSEIYSGIHTRATVAYKAYTGSLLVDNSLYTYRTNGDSLILSNAIRVVALVKAGAIDPEKWVGTVTTGNSISLPLSSSYFGALEWNGTEFLLSNFNKRIFKMTGTGQFTDSTNITTKSYGICLHGGSIYTNGYGTDNKLRTIDFATGATLTNSSDNTSGLSGNTSDGTYIWCSTQEGSLVYYNPVTDVFTLKSNLFPSSGGGGGLPALVDMAIKDGYAYAASPYLGIFKINLSTGLIEGTYQSAGGLILGVAFKDNQLMGLVSDGLSYIRLTEITLQ